MYCNSYNNINNKNECKFKLELKLVLTLTLEEKKIQTLFNANIFLLALGFDLTLISPPLRLMALNSFSFATNLIVYYLLPKVISLKVSIYNHIYVTP
jgi:hypothetical protein